VLSPATPAFSLTIKQLMDESPLAKYNYKEVAKQFDDIYKLIEVKK
jgi:hypothetical protein